MKLRKAAIPAILALASLGNAQVSAPPFAILRSAPSAESRTRGLVRLTLDLRTGARGCQALDVFQLTPSDVTWPRWRANVTTRVKVVDGRTLTVYGGAGRTTLLVLRCPGVTPYALHGPFEWPVRPERQVVDLRLRRTIRGTLPDQVSPPRVIWLDGDDSIGGDPWPTCWAAGPAAWECIGLRSGALGCRRGAGYAATDVWARARADVACNRPSDRDATRRVGKARSDPGRLRRC